MPETLFESGDWKLLRDVDGVVGMEHVSGYWLEDIIGDRSYSALEHLAEKEWAADEQSHQCR